jgi:hypothetical protein
MSRATPGVGRCARVRDGLCRKDGVALVLSLSKHGTAETFTLRRAQGCDGWSPGTST